MQAELPERNYMQSSIRRNGTEMEQKKKFIINTIFYTIIGVIVVCFCRYILPALMPFMIAFLVAALVQIPIKKFKINSVGKRKAFAIFLCGCFYMAFFFLVAAFGIKLMEGIEQFVISIPTIYDENIVPLLDEVSGRLEAATASMDHSLSQKIEDVFLEISQNLGKYASDLSVNMVRWISGGAKGIPGFLVKLVITIVSTFFIAVDFEKVTNFFQRLVPPDKEDMAGKGVDYIKNIVFVYIKSYSLLFFLTFLELSAGFLILRIPYGIGIALLIAVFDILPILGTGGILLPWAVVLFVMGNKPLAAGILILYVIITVIRNIVEPKIVGKQIGLHPLVTLMAMFLGLKTFGIIGMIVLPVSLAVLINLEKNGIIYIFNKK